MALTNIRVIDLSRLLPGPLATQMLADLGAEVIKIEDEEMGDYARFYKPDAGDGNSTLFHSLQGKKSIILNLKLKNDCEKLMNLLSYSDVLVESFRPGVMEKLGFGIDKLINLFPKLIICSISGFGQSTADSHRAGHDVNYLTKAGVLSYMPNPVILPIQLVDIAGGSYPAVIQILAAIQGRHLSGKGTYIDVNMTKWSRSLRILADASIPLNSEEAKEPFFLDGVLPCYTIYKTKDGFISVGALEPKFWKKFCQILKIPHLENLGLDLKQADEVKKVVEDILILKTGEYWQSIFKNQDVCVEVIEKPGSMDNNPDIIQKVPVIINNETFNFPITPFSYQGGNNLQIRNERAPLIGENTNDKDIQLLLVRKQSKL